MVDSRAPRCFSCSKVLAKQYDEFDGLTDEDGFSNNDAVALTKVTRSCCSRMVLTGVEISTQLREPEINVGPKIMAQEAVSSVVKKVIRGPNGREIVIHHLGDYRPPEAPKEIQPSPTLLTEQSPRLPFDPTDREPSPLSWVGRKRFLAIVSFLTQVVAPLDEDADPPGILYLGASGDGHLPYLIELFGNLHWIIHGSDFPKAVRDRINSKQVEVLPTKKAVLSLDDVKPYKQKVRYVISEYRTAKASSGTANYTLDVQKDMTFQQQVVIELAPEYALLRFALPYPQNWNGKANITYLDGLLTLPPWNASRGTECYLNVHYKDYSSPKVTNPKYREYGVDVYDQQMNYHNRKVRLEPWIHPAQNITNGLDACWDCASECAIHAAYLRKTEPNLVFNILVKRTREMTLRLNQTLSDGKYTLIQPPPQEHDEERPEP
jgi:DNA-directed RNA polymerase subunit N (RpoN/RPB10)